MLEVPISPLKNKKEKFKDFRSSMSWRVFRIMAELVEGWEHIADFRDSVTIFGSARVKEDSHWYEEARRLGNLLAKAGLAVVTGGGPGIMEAANRGAHEAGGDSVGLNIDLPEEQEANRYVNRPQGFRYFFIRKLMLTYAAKSYVYFPGGYGTLDEFFEMITLVQTGKIPSIPIILVGKEYWQPFDSFIKAFIIEKFGYAHKEDANLYQIVETAEEVLRIVLEAPKRDHFINA